MKNIFHFLLLSILLSSFCLQTQAQKLPKNSKDTAAIFDNYVQKAVKDWNIPGLAIVVVKNNQIVFKKTYEGT
jgi:CubicO group peptidase (beta-lactamase class C family)